MMVIHVTLSLMAWNNTRAENDDLMKRRHVGLFKFSTAHSFCKIGLKNESITAKNNRSIMALYAKSQRNTY